MTTANKITLSRLALLPVFLYCIYGYSHDREALRIVALWVYVVAALSDMADGWVARNCNQISRLGRRLDPLADKMLINLGYVFVAANPHFSPGVPLWAPPIFLARDVYIVLGAYIINEHYGPVKVAPRLSGKSTTALQMAAMVAVLASWRITYVLLLGAVAASVWSAADYFVAGLKQVQEKNKD